MPLTHEVVKSVVTDGGRKIAGELVDPSGWGMPVRRLQQLEDQRYIRPVSGSVTPVPTVDGRFWASSEWPRKYGLQLERPPRKADVAVADVGVEDEPPSADPAPEASPAAANLAKKHGIDLSSVTGTGTGGRIIKSDVTALIGE